MSEPNTCGNCAFRGPVIKTPGDDDSNWEDCNTSYFRIDPMKILFAIVLLLLTLTAYARDQSELRKFKATHACPYTQQQGCIVDHIKPLCLGGADKAFNMQWQTRRASYRKDAWERRKCRQRKGKS